MRRTYVLIVVVFGMAVTTFAETTSSESQTLKALLTEVRQLREDLQGSLTSMASAQILLSRLQIQEVAVSRASEHLDDARSKLAEVQLVLRSEAAEIKHFEDAQIPETTQRKSKLSLTAPRPTSKPQRISRSNASRQKQKPNCNCEPNRRSSAGSNHYWTNLLRK